MATTRKNSTVETAPEAVEADEVPTVEEVEAQRAQLEAEDSVTDSKVSEAALKNRLRNEAEREVLNKYRDEYNALCQAKFEAKGLVYSRRLTDEEKAEKQLKDLLAAHPELAAKYAPSGQ